MKKKNILPQVDILSIQLLYGSGSKQTVSSRTTTTKSTTRSVNTEKSHPRCYLFIDAGFDYPDGTFHTLDSGNLWRYMPNDQRWENRAKPYKNTYQRLPKQVVGGVYDTTTHQLLIFSGVNVYLYEISHASNKAHYFRTDHLASHLRNSIVGAIYYLEQIYIVKKATLVLFDIDNPNKKSTERALKEEFPLFSGSVTAAFSYGDLHHFFTSDRLVYVWSEQLNAWKTFAKPMETSWFACSANKRN